MQVTISAEELQALYAQVQQVYNSFRALRGEAQGILATSDMPDSQSQLSDVLQSTETATMAIITHVAAISTIVAESNIPDDKRTQVDAHVATIYESCSFQDITGQRIQKVMVRLQALEEQLLSLSKSAKILPQMPLPEPAKTDEDGLKNGPQLSSVAPSQSDIDNLFNT